MVNNTFPLVDKKGNGLFWIAKGEKFTLNGSKRNPMVHKRYVGIRLLKSPSVTYYANPVAILGCING